MNRSIESSPSHFSEAAMLPLYTSPWQSSDLLYMFLLWDIYYMLLKGPKDGPVLTTPPLALL